MALTSLTASVAGLAYVYLYAEMESAPGLTVDSRPLILQSALDEIEQEVKNAKKK